MKDIPYSTSEHSHRGHTIKIEWFYDQDSRTPWEECEGFGQVSDWTRRDKLPGERVLCSDRNSHRYYDYAAAIAEAKRDGWDSPPYKTGTKGEQAVRAVEAAFKYLQDCCEDRWHWAGCVITIDGFDYDKSLWGIDSPSQAQYEKDAIQNAKDWLDHEIMEQDSAACRDCATM